MAFEGLDLSNLQNLLKQYGGGAGGGAAPAGSAPPTGNGVNIRPNMAPPENFWQGDQFKIGAPGMQAVPPGQAPPQQPQQPQMPPQMGAQGGGFDGAAYLAANPDVVSYFQQNPNALKQFGGDMNKGAEHHYNTYGRNEGRQPGGAMAGGQNPLMGGQQPQGPASPRIMARTPGNMNINPLIGGKY